MVKWEKRPPDMVPVDANVPCGIEFPGRLVEAANGKAYCRLPIVRETLPNGVEYDTIDLGPTIGDNYGPITVPAGRVFLMGDNRDRSADSRFPAVENEGIGLVHEDNLVGHALVGMFSTDGSASWFNPISWFTAARWDRIGDGF
jgi:signal peptidase I